VQGWVQYEDLLLAIVFQRLVQAHIFTAAMVLLHILCSRTLQGETMAVEGMDVVQIITSRPGSYLGSSYAIQICLIRSRPVSPHTCPQVQ
jgi:hypothetical protein